MGCSTAPVAGSTFPRDSALDAKAVADNQGAVDAIDALGADWSAPGVPRECRATVPPPRHVRHLTVHAGGGQPREYTAAALARSLPPVDAREPAEDGPRVASRITEPIRAALAGCRPGTIRDAAAVVAAMTVGERASLAVVLLALKAAGPQAGAVLRVAVAVYTDHVAAASTDPR